MPLHHRRYDRLQGNRANGCKVDVAERKLLVYVVKVSHDCWRLPLLRWWPVKTARKKVTSG
jgi:hypothetical protein